RKDWLGNSEGVFAPTGGAPTGKLTPAALKAKIVESVKAQAQGKFTDKARALKDLEAKVTSFLTNELFPQFVIADTNWGSANGKVYHVVAPDLDTGEPKLFQKDEATGMLTAETDD